jgi:hypothetical protein
MVSMTIYMYRKKVKEKKREIEIGIDRRIE